MMLPPMSIPPLHGPVPMHAMRTLYWICKAHRQRVIVEMREGELALVPSMGAIRAYTGVPCHVRASRLCHSVQALTIAGNGVEVYLQSIIIIPQVRAGHSRGRHRHDT